MAHFDDLTFSQAVDVFLKNADWLSAKDQPAVTGLQKVAQALDNRVSASLMAEFSKLWKALQPPKDEENKQFDELDIFLKGVSNV